MILTLHLNAPVAPELFYYEVCDLTPIDRNVMMIQRKDGTMGQINWNETMGSFLTDLGSDLPAPGGGAAAGISGALGAALGRMVASLTLGRKKYEMYAPEAEQVQKKLGDIMKQFVELSDRDAEAYGGYMKAASMPRNTEEEMLLRRESMQEAIRNSAQIPYETLELCASALKLVGSLYGKSNVTCVGDLACGAAELSAAARIAWLNVLANLPYFSDREAAQNLFFASQTLLVSTIARADELYSKIESDLESKMD